MLEGLNPRTRLEVLKLVTGRTTKLGKETLALENEAERKMLFIIAQSNAILSHETGASLQEKVLELWETTTVPIAETYATKKPDDQIASPRWRIGKIVAQSFRGLAPALHEWSFDLEGKCHLLFGPNGSGKTSLLGALSWCLTGKIFRDDGAPSNPESVSVFSTTEEPKLLGERPDALALMDADGQSTGLNELYWVKLQFLGTDADGNTKVRWLQRNSNNGLSSSDDGISWLSIKSIQEIGLSEMDAEMHVLMPARVPYLRYGKDSDFLTLFSQVVGLDDLEQIAEIAGKLHSALIREANKIEREEIAKADKEVKSRRDEILGFDKAYFQGFLTYNTYCNSTTSTDTGAFGKEIVAELEIQKKQLLADLGIENPEKSSAQAEADLTKKLDKLPGNVDVALTSLARPLAKIFKNAFEVEGKTEEEIGTLQRKLDAFEQYARARTSERLDWAIKEQGDPKTRLMLAAAEHFAKKEEECPVCKKPLKDAPHVRAHLREMVAFIGKAYLQKLIDDLEASLICELDAIVPSVQRHSAEKDLKERLLLDWKILKEGVFSGLLMTVATRFDTKIEALCDGMDVEKNIVHKSFSDGHPTFSHAFKKLDAAIESAKKYLLWLKHLNKYRTLLESNAEGALLTNEDSLKKALEKGVNANAKIKVYASAIQSCAHLFKQQKEIETLKNKVISLRTHAESTEKIKLLNKCVGDEIVQFVEKVEPRIKEFYEYLYPQEQLRFDTLTTGHPANKNIRNTMNVYFRAGTQRVPASPFTNAGRLRALTISFVFALLDALEGSFDTLILDDPVYSFDEEHKARFLDRLVQPLLESKKQVVLATHYKTFFDQAAPIFAEHVCLQMTPKRRVGDMVNFEPTDLLQRAEDEMNLPTCKWREASTNLRKWAERTLKSLSAYCPEPFIVFNDFSASVNRYKAITDLQIATGERDQIVSVLQSNEFTRVCHKLMHDGEEPTETEVRDALNKLKNHCKRVAEREIARLKTLHLHRITNRQVSAN